MAKRGPQSELTDRNWDQEEEPEECGVFKQATKEAMQGRVIRKAKRKGATDDNGGSKSGAFGGFGGFGGFQKTSSAAPTGTSMFSGKTTDTDDDVISFKPSMDTNSSNLSTPLTTPASSSNNDKDNSVYLNALKSLNESVLSWIKQHVDKNPYIILTPIFKDYEKYLSSLEAKKSSNSNSSNSGQTALASASPKNEESDKKLTDFSSKPSFAAHGDKEKEKEKSSFAFSFGSSSSSATNGSGFKFASATSSQPSSSTAATTSGFSFSSSTSPVSTGFTFGKSTTTTTAATSGFSFGSTSSSGGAGLASTSLSSGAGGSAGFSFGALAAKAASEKQESTSTGAGAEDDDYVPPKPEVKEIKEEGSLFSKRCKLFYQKEGQWTERGVGNVHVKPLANDKTQLLIRADTNLGNILLNINVTSALPVSRQGKNNILLVCVPNPPLKEGKEENSSTAVPMLVRIKTGEEADEMLSILDERKKLL